jgi:hypothetical protein
VTTRRAASTEKHLASDGEAAEADQPEENKLEDKPSQKKPPNDESPQDENADDELPNEPAPSKPDEQGTGASPGEMAPAAATPGGGMTVMNSQSVGPDGVLWTTRDFCYGDNEYGATKVPAADGKAVIVEPKLSDLAPALSGRWYAYSQYNADANRSVITVVDPESLEVLFEKSMPDLLYGFTPHPVERHLVLGSLSIDRQTRQNSVIVDLERGQVVQRIEPIGLVDWMSDGRYMRMAADGKRWSGALGEEERALPSMELPTGYSAGVGFWISPDNKQLVIQLQRYANDAWSDDLWIGSMDGGPLERLTRSTMTSYAVWSPDSRYVAFDVDPDIHAACGISFSPERWHQNAHVYYVEATARDVARPADAHTFKALGSSAKYRLLGWTKH